MKKEGGLSEKSKLALWTCSEEGREELFERIKGKLKEKEKCEKITNPEFGEWQMAIPLKAILQEREKKSKSKRTMREKIDVFIPVEYKVEYKLKDTIQVAPSSSESGLLVKVKPYIQDLMEVIGEMRGYREFGIPVLVTYSTLSEAEEKAFENAGITVHSISKAKTQRFEKGRSYQEHL